MAFTTAEYYMYDQNMINICIYYAAFLADGAAGDQQLHMLRMVHI